LGVYLSCLIYLWPLQECRHNLQQSLKSGPPGPIKTQNRKELSIWTCELHNGIHL
jgi:hypothetical protein